MKYQSPPGTQDILPKDSQKWQKIIDVSREVLEFFSYKEIIIPAFEHTELFQRSVGESTDIVNKEMYTFLDRSERSLTLRPEATAGIVRAFIENSLHREPKPVKLWTYGPMFRYERAQTGRYRQFHQIDAEVLSDSSISCEIESILLLLILLNQLKVEYKIEINSLGDEESKRKYKKYFKEHTEHFLGSLCEDCKRRHEQNPLRMLDCKVKEDQEIYANAKKPLDYLSDESSKRWEEIKYIFGLNNEGYKGTTMVNSNLVRGLDYYNDFVFEVKSTNEILKGQSTICAGGRYDNLVESLGGPKTPGFGWAIGIERLMMVLNTEKKKNIKLMFLTNQPYLVYQIQLLYAKSRQQGFKMDIELNHNTANIGKQIEVALKKEADFVIFYLDEEAISRKFKIKDLKEKKEYFCSDNSDELLKFLEDKKSNVHTNP